MATNASCHKNFEKFVLCTKVYTILVCPYQQRVFFFGCYQSQEYYFRKFPFNKEYGAFFARGYDSILEIENFHFFYYRPFSWRELHVVLSLKKRLSLFRRHSSKRKLSAVPTHSKFCPPLPIFDLNNSSTTQMEGTTVTCFTCHQKFFVARPLSIPSNSSTSSFINTPPSPDSQFYSRNISWEQNEDLSGYSPLSLSDIFTFQRMNSSITNTSSVTYSRQLCMFFLKFLVAFQLLLSGVHGAKIALLFMLSMLLFLWILDYERSSVAFLE